MCGNLCFLHVSVRTYIVSSSDTLVGSHGNVCLQGILAGVGRGEEGLLGCRTRLETLGVLGG